MIKEIRTKIQKDIHLKEMLSGSVSFFIIKIIGIAFGYVFTLLITRNYGAAVMGTFALSLTVLQITSILGRLGMDSAQLRFTAEYSAQNRWDLLKEFYLKSFKAVFFTSLFLSVSLFLLSPYISRYIFHKEHLSSYFRLISLGVVPFALHFINYESLRGLKKIREYAFLQNTAVFLFSSVLIGVFVLIYKDSHIPVLTYVIAVYLAFTVGSFLWFKKSGFKSVEIMKNQIRWRNILDVSIPMLFSSSLFFIMGWTSTIMLGIFATEKDLGIFNVALKVAGFTSIMLMAVNSIAAPKFGEFWGNGQVEEMRKIAQSSAKLIFWLSFPALLVLFLFPSQVLGIFGNEFKTGSTALIILTFGQFINAISGSVGQILKMTGKQKIQSKIIFVAVLMNMFLNYTLIPVFGISGAAISSAISTIFWNVGHLVVVYKNYNFINIYLPLTNIFLLRKRI